jgi:signal transduction histidine kinase
MKHGGRGVVSVRLAAAGRDLELIVEDRPGGGGGEAASTTPRPRWPTRTTGSGLGIRGMRERATAVGGTLEAGPTPEGGFRVVARVPGSLR